MTRRNVLGSAKYVQDVAVVQVLEVVKVVGRRGKKQEAGREPKFLAMTRAGVYITRETR